MENLISEKDKLLIKKIEISKDFTWLKKLLEKQTEFSEVVLKKINTLPSLEIQNLIKELYEEENKKD